MASRCFSPPLSRWPRSPTTVSRPSGSSSTSALICAARRAAWISLVRGVGSGVEQVGADRVVEEVRLLRDDTDAVAQRRHRHVAQVDAADAHGALARVVEPGHEGGQRRLAGARGPDEGDEVTGGRRDGDVVEHDPAATTVTRGDRLERGERDLVGRRVAERHVVELDAERTAGQGDGAGALLDERLEVEHLEDALEGDERRHDVDAHVGQRRQRAVETGQQGGEGQQRADRERAVDGHDAAEAVDHRRRERRDEREGGHEHRAVERDLDADVADATGALGILGLLTGRACRRA